MNLLHLEKIHFLKKKKKIMHLISDLRIRKIVLEITVAHIQPTGYCTSNMFMLDFNTL